MDELYRDKWTAVVGWFRRHGSTDPENDAGNTFLRVAQAKPTKLSAQYLWQAARRVRIDAFRRAAVRPHAGPLPTTLHIPVNPWLGVDEMLDVQQAWPQLTTEQRGSILRSAAGDTQDRAGNKRRLRGLASLRKLVS
jgi:hypothetical protein